MNIAHLLPYSAKFPLRSHNGRYEYVLRLAKLQAAAGHEVSIYAAPGSTNEEKRITWLSHSQDHDDKRHNNLELIKTAFNNDSHDIFHSHFDSLHYSLADLTPKPVVFTQHWFPNNEIAAAVRLNNNDNVIAVPGSRLMAQTDDKLGIPHAEVIHQGIDLDLFKFSLVQPSDRLIFVGRIAPWKGVLEAVNIAHASGQKLDLVGKLNEKELPYWQKIEPMVDNKQIRYLGPKTRVEVAQLVAQAKAFIFPSQVPEAAPQAPIEAQACGTPVIISNVGASAEIIIDGKTGFLANSVSDYARAIENIHTIDRVACRQFAEQFDIKLMAKSYEELYKKLLS